ncbi:MAG: CoA transferase [Actinomycetota bacterium]
MPSPAPLAGVVVLDDTDLRGALCARLLADLGADVRRIRHADDDGSPADRFRNARKRTVEPGEVDLADVDVYVENHGPAADLDRAAIAAEHPTLIHIALTDLGLTGDRAHWRLEPLCALAASGGLHAAGFPHLPPTSLPGYLAHDCGSIHGALGATGALLDRSRTGLGQLVEVSAQEAALGGLVPWTMIVPDYLDVNPFLPVEGGRNADGLYYVFPCADGHVRVVLGHGRDWELLVELLGSPDELSGPEWKNLAHRGMNTPTIRKIAQARLGDRTRADVYAEAMDMGLPLGMVQTPLEFVAHAQNDARGFLRDSPIAATPWNLHATPSPPLDEIPEAARPAIPEPNDGPLPQLLDGVRIVEFGVAAVVPEFCWMMSELGAEVVKIESAGKMDNLRFTGMGDPDKGFAFNAEGRGRSGITLDLGNPEGRRLAKELCLQADIVAENNRGGMMARLGLDHPDLAEARPDLIYVASQGYGRGGPMGQMKAYGPLNAAFAGLHLLWSHPDGPYPSGTALNHPDHIAGKLVASAALAALGHRDRTGEGQLIDMAQTEVAVYLLGEQYLEAIESGLDPVNHGNRHPHQAPHGVYPAAGADEWIAVAVHTDEAWAALEQRCGWHHDPSLATADARVARRDELDDRLRAWTSQHDRAAAAEALQAVGVSAMPVMGPLDQLADPHLVGRDFVDEVEHPVAGTEHHVRNPTRFGRTELRTAGPAPRLGADTRDVLRRWLALDDAELDRLAEAGALT